MFTLVLDDDETPSQIEEILQLGGGRSGYAYIPTAGDDMLVCIAGRWSRCGSRTEISDSNVVSGKRYRAMKREPCK